jgi:hypothetical protein
VGTGKITFAARVGKARPPLLAMVRLRIRAARLSAIGRFYAKEISGEVDSGCVRIGLSRVIGQPGGSAAWSDPPGTANYLPLGERRGPPDMADALGHHHPLLSRESRPSYDPTTLGRFVYPRFRLAW